MGGLKKTSPQGVDYSIIYDPTVFVRESMHAVIETLLEALLLVVIVVVLFLQTWRAALIPVIAVPVAIIGSFAAMSAFGFSINTLTLFGLVLAEIGRASGRERVCQYVKISGVAVSLQTKIIIK